MGSKPRVLLVATSRKPRNYFQELEAGHYPRIDYAEAAQRLAVDYVDYDLLPRGNKLFETMERKLRVDLRLALAARGLVRARGYDIVVSMSERVGIPLALLLPASVRHVLLPWHLLSPAKLRVTRALRRWVRWNSMLVVSGAEADALRRALNPGSVDVLPRWVDTVFFVPEASPEAESEQSYVLSVGLSYRDYPTLIEAMRSVPDMRCRIRAGSSWVEGNVTGTGVPANVSVEGLVRPDILRADYQGCRFVVVPVQRTTQWSAGMTAALEAQAMGKAVIATEMPGMSEYVLQGETGLLVPPQDPQAMRAAIRELWTDPSRAETMGKRARQWVMHRFSLETWLDHIANELQLSTVKSVS